MTQTSPFQAQIEELTQSLSTAEKVQLCHASTKFSVKGVERAGIPDMVMSDGPHGVRREISIDSWDPVDTDDDYSTYLPTGTAVAATWNPEMGILHGKVLGSEARERGKDVILGPGFNIIRSPLCGRNFEYYSEDPYLISKMVKGAIEAIQEMGTAACAKHFACNSQELNRHGVNALPSERALREIYLPGFKAAVDAGVLTIMGAYNLLRGQWCCQNDTLLNEILKKEWGFPGVVISDWNGVHKNTYEPAYNGMDIEMGTALPFDDYYLAQPFLKAIEAGEIDEEVLDDKVRRYLHVMFSIDAMGSKVDQRPKGERNTKAHQAAALKIAEEAIVLLKNEKQTLPFSKNIKKLLVVGDNATVQHHPGGASSAVKALYEVTPLEGIQQLLGDKVDIQHMPDPTPGEGFPIPTTVLSPADLGAGVNGWKGQVYDKRSISEQDAPIKELAHNSIDIDWSQQLPEGISDELEWHMSWNTTLTAPETGTYTFILHGARDAGLVMDGTPIIQRYENENDPESASVQLQLEKGQELALHLYIIPHVVMSSKKVSLRWISPQEQCSSNLEDITDAAQQADAVIYVGGLTHQQDTEGKDRLDMDLPGRQNEVIATLAKANNAFAAVMVSGSPYTMPWVDEVPAILQIWYGGMEVGHAAAKTIFGDVNPSGKLPFTFPKQLQDSPGHALNDYDADVCYYKEDIYVGYRWFDRQNIEPLFCFGHGLSYTTFEYSDLKVTSQEQQNFTIEAQIKNTGHAKGSEVVQLYLHDSSCSVGRPAIELKGFQKVELEAQASTSVSFNIGVEELQFFHPSQRKWMAESGNFEVHLSSSSRDHRCQGSFQYQN